MVEVNQVGSKKMNWIHGKEFEIFWQPEILCFSSPFVANAKMMADMWTDTHAFFLSLFLFCIFHLEHSELFKVNTRRLRDFVSACARSFFAVSERPFSDCTEEMVFIQANKKKINILPEGTFLTPFYLIPSGDSSLSPHGWALLPLPC